MKMEDISLIFFRIWSDFCVDISLKKVFYFIRVYVVVQAVRSMKLVYESTQVFYQEKNLLNIP